MEASSQSRIRSSFNSFLLTIAKLLSPILEHEFEKLLSVLESIHEISERLVLLPNVVRLIQQKQSKNSRLRRTGGDREFSVYFKRLNVEAKYRRFMHGIWMKSPRMHDRYEDLFGCILPDFYCMEMDSDQQYDKWRAAIENCDETIRLFLDAQRITFKQHLLEASFLPPDLANIVWSYLSFA